MFGLILIMIYEAFYGSSGQAQPIAFAQVVSYVWLGQALLALLPWNVDTELRAMARSGAVAYELCRPVDLYCFWFARGLAWRLAPALLRSIPLSLLAIFVLPWIGLGEWRLQFPSLSAGLAFGAAMVGTLLLGCAISTFLNITLLWTVSNDGAYVVLTALVSMFSGLIVPLPLFPGWAQSILMAMPFAGLADLPYRLYTGNIDAGTTPLILLHQLIWTAIIVVAGRWMLRRGMSRVVVQGG